MWRSCRSDCDLQLGNSEPRSHYAQRKHRGDAGCPDAAGDRIHPAGQQCDVDGEWSDDQREHQHVGKRFQYFGRTGYSDRSCRYRCDLPNHGHAHGGIPGQRFALVLFRNPGEYWDDRVHDESDFEPDERIGGKFDGNHPNHHAADNHDSRVAKRRIVVCIMAFGLWARVVGDEYRRDDFTQAAHPDGAADWRGVRVDRVAVGVRFERNYHNHGDRNSSGNLQLDRDGNVRDGFENVSGNVGGAVAGREHGYPSRYRS